MNRQTSAELLMAYRWDVHPPDMVVVCKESRNQNPGRVGSVALLISIIPLLYFCSPSSGSDVSMQMQLLSACTHSLFLRAQEPVCAISLGACN